ncbi:MAG: peptidoglycan DD-metalloendopeptidase family protein [Thermoanaerobaculia bacterium]
MRKLLAMGARVGGVLWRPRAYVAAAIPLSLPFLLASISPDVAAPRQETRPAPELRYADLVSAIPAQLPEHSVLVPVENGDTIADVLQTAGMNGRESGALALNLSTVIDLRRLRPGNLVRFHYTADGTIDSIELKVNGWGQVDAVRNGDRFEVTPHPAEQREIDTAFTATIETSLYDAVRAAGEGPQVVQQLVDVFQWDVDFFALQRGDSFSVIVRKKFAGGDTTGYGPIVAARFTHEGITYEAFRHEWPDGQAGYYARAGTPLRKQFLRAPLQFTRITSRFSGRRFHPILHTFRPHHGVDYGAPVGTPVMTTADGVVVEAGRKAGEGNFIRVRHSSRIDTYYLHLSRFAKNIKRGAKVVQGDVIGYVGSTGLATGPHLDYRVREDGMWLDPLKLKSITPDPLRADALRQFRRNVATLSPRLQNAAGQTAGLDPRRALF